MPILEPVIVQMLLNGFLKQGGKAGGRSKAELCLLGFSGLCFAAGAIYLLIALHAWLAENYAPVTAGLVTGCVAFAAGCVSVLCAIRLEASRHRRRSASGTDQASEAVLAMLDSLTQGLEAPVAGNPRTAIALASLAGYMAGNKLH